MNEALIKKALRHLRKNDPVLKAVIARVGVLKIELQPDAFTRLARAIVGQQISRAAARSVWMKLEGLRPNGRGKLRPEHIVRATDAVIRSCGVSQNKLLSLRDLAAHLIDKRVNPQQFPRMDNEEIIAALIPIRGIGRWTAEMYLMFGLGRPDVLPVDDLGLQNAIMKAYRLKKRPDAKKIRTHAKKWAPYETVASFYLWRSLDTDTK